MKYRHILTLILGLCFGLNALALPYYIPGKPKPDFNTPTTPQTLSLSSLSDPSALSDTFNALLKTHQLSKVEYLDVSNNTLNTHNEAYFISIIQQNQLPNLKTLSLSRNHIDNAPALLKTILAHCPQFQGILYQNLPLDETDAITALYATHPRLTTYLGPVTPSNVNTWVNILKSRAFIRLAFVQVQLSYENTMALIDTIAKTQTKLKTFGFVLKHFSTGNDQTHENHLATGITPILPVNPNITTLIIGTPSNFAATMPILQLSRAITQLKLRHLYIVNQVAKGFMRIGGTVMFLANSHLLSLTQTGNANTANMLSMAIDHQLMTYNHPVMLTIKNVHGYCFRKVFNNHLTS